MFLHLRDDCWKQKKPSAYATKATPPVPGNLSTSIENPVIVPSVSELVPGTGYTFRNFHYAITHISWKPAAEKRESYTNAGYIMTIAD